ncbi:formate dehydrogenase accessory sulfurtransferase FdhD [Agromyces sp. Leaf222]|uniref:formate dehydrogenase accessory sulfurtransferase FdhD n=1 Tax=Agromyces sp. Leaf222 TaxID=1735688 RepID=UPI0006F1CA1C|nr:formate dehydrogenase accessory sulfurtransferase FdhD [Agromyces sp. Leaf222]KQM81132.1 formate dehydrogenase family accessory protein FdhD [Agromyces sp. Leaf222]
MGRITARKRVTRITVGGRTNRRDDLLAVEEPLEIRIGRAPLAVTMRTPGHDVDLAVGFLVSEGVISRGDQVAAAIHCASDEGENTYNVLDLTLANGVPQPDAAARRDLYISSSCGVCGKASIDAVHTRTSHPVADADLRVDPELLIRFPDRLRAGQAIFEKTGGLHAAALFDARTGEMIVLREDVGRHNAVDKVVGWAAREGLLPLSGLVLQVSGRASFELTQKASMAGIPVLAAVSAPSSLAVEHAANAGITLVGFMRGDTMVVYAGAERIADGTAGQAVERGADRVSEQTTTAD